MLTVGDKKSVRSITTYPEQTRWGAEALAKIKATPWSEREVVDSVVRVQAPIADRQGVEVAAPVGLDELQAQRAGPADARLH